MKCLRGEPGGRRGSESQSQARSRPSTSPRPSRRSAATRRTAFATPWPGLRRDKRRSSGGRGPLRWRRTTPGAPARPRSSSARSGWWWYRSCFLVVVVVVGVLPAPARARLPTSVWSSDDHRRARPRPLRKLSRSLVASEILSKKKKREASSSFGEIRDGVSSIWRRWGGEESRSVSRYKHGFNRITGPPQRVSTRSLAPLVWTTAPAASPRDKAEASRWPCRPRSGSCRAPSWRS